MSFFKWPKSTEVILLFGKLISIGMLISNNAIINYVLDLQEAQISIF